MEPRSLKRLSNVPASERNTILAAGLGQLGRYVHQLADDADFLRDSGRESAAAVLDVFAAEQAASFVILLDLARAGWGVDAKVIKQQIFRFSDHLARGLYAEAYWGCPATLGELEETLEHDRRSLYLDGPADVDWTFRNSIHERREGSLYVDYIAYEDQCLWESPLNRDHSFRLTPKVVKLVVSLTAVGVCDAQALDRLADIWRAIDITDRKLHWQTVRSANADMLDWLLKRNGPTEREHARRVLEDWIHPLNHLDLSYIEVPKADLEAERQRWLEREAW